MEENMKSKFNNEFALVLKNREDRTALNQKTISEIGNIIKQFTAFGKEMSEITKKNLNIYFEWVLSKIAELNNSSETCIFLHSENRVYCSKVIEAKIRKDGYDAKYFQTVIDEIINPLLNDWESALDFEKRNPSVKLIVQSTNALQEKSENPNPLQVI